MPTHRADPGDPLSLHALLVDDETARRALTDAYTGPHDILDAVWWREHPLTPTPEGRPDPAAARVALQKRAFAPGVSEPLVEVLDADSGEVVCVPESAARLVALEGRLRSDAAALDKALVDARPALDAATARRAPAATPAPTPTPVVKAPASGSAETHTAAAAPTPTLETWRRRSQLWMWTAVAAGLLLLAGVGIAVAQQLSPTANVFGRSAGSIVDPSGSPATSSADPAATATALPPGLTIFEDPSLAPSIPPQNIDPYYKPESLRLLGVADSELTVYAVENRIDQPCLLAVYVDGTQSATCVTKQEFASMGIELRITSLRATPAGEAAPDPSEDVVFWNSDGSYGVSSSPGRNS
ncbi:hypothetical protein [Subtercola sp. Z020]|uniref:hypothetical protein n=1 Tax=Subtercola sp. Z020 TaxID=2080582 RepID=UPI0011B0A495|nr:hypothetical protein [Subtercola sp. Z020]